MPATRPARNMRDGEEQASKQAQAQAPAPELNKYVKVEVHNFIAIDAPIGQTNEGFLIPRGVKWSQVPGSNIQELAKILHLLQADEAFYP